MDIPEFVSFINTAQDRMRSEVSVTLNETATLIRNELRRTAPVDKGDFRESWNVDTAHTSGNTVAVSIFNSRRYAPVLEQGSPEGQLPWPTINTRKRLVAAKDGRIWSKKAIGGTVEPLFKDVQFVERIVSKVLESAVRGFANG